MRKLASMKLLFFFAGLYIISVLINHFILHGIAMYIIALIIGILTFCVTLLIAIFDFVPKPNKKHSNSQSKDSPKKL